MKKIIKVLVLFSIFFIGFNTFSANASASGWSSWTNSPVGGGCQTRVWNDVSTYTTQSTTVDYQVQQNGSCGTLYYNSYVAQYGQSPAYYVRISPVQTGYFNQITPIKYFYITDFTKTGVAAVVMIDFYKDSSKTQYIGSDYSPSFTINQR